MKTTYEERKTIQTLMEETSKFLDKELNLDLNNGWNVIMKNIILGVEFNRLVKVVGFGLPKHFTEDIYRLNHILAGFNEVRNLKNQKKENYLKNEYLVELDEEWTADLEWYIGCPKTSFDKIENKYGVALYRFEEQARMRLQIAEAGKLK